MTLLSVNEMRVLAVRFQFSSPSQNLILSSIQRKKVPFYRLLTQITMKLKQWPVAIQPALNTFQRCL